MAIDRRHFLTGASVGVGVGLASALWPLPATHALAVRQKNLLITACRRGDGSFCFLILTPEGEVVRSIPLTGRGHDVALHEPSGAVVAFARRPGRFALSFNVNTAANPVVFAPPKARHFYGHGTFSHDGRLLYTTENDFDNARGVVGVYDATASFARVGEFESYGVGAHDMVLLADGKTLVVANGGIETHPESGRTKLNVGRMEPSLCFISSADGALITRHTLARDYSQLSIRHLTADESGKVWFGGQWQGESTTSPGLVGCARKDELLRLLEGAEDTAPRLRGYIGSVALSGDGRWLAASAPRAGKVIYFDTKKPGVWRHTDIKDASGVASLQDHTFLTSSGAGELRTTALPSEVEQSTGVAGISFDNHVRVCRVR